MSHDNAIHIKGARVHNLKNIELSIPHETLTVITGLSGSGKSTLAFDTIFAEGQRRYVESLSAYARQFLGRIGKPDVDMIEGIAPAIAIEQKVSTRNPRSTVGTSTEIYDYLKLLFARIGRTYSPISGAEVRCYGVDDIADQVNAKGEGVRTVIAAPLVTGKGQGIVERMLQLIGEGILRVMYRSETMLVEEFMPRIDRTTSADEILIVIDRLKTSFDDDTQTRLRDSIARALSYGDGVAAVVTDRTEVFSSRFEQDGILFEPPTEHLFSFNNPLGACPRCEGYGKVVGIDENLVVPDKSKTIYEGAIACWNGATMSKWRDELILNSSKFGFPIHTPYHELTAQQRQTLWRGNEYFHGLDEFFEYIDSQRRKIQFRVMKARYTGKTLCPECNGSRLRKEALYVRIAGRNIADLTSMNVDSLIGFFDSLSLDEHDTKTAARILTEIRNRLGYLSDVGLGYLTLDRLSSTLSGGESQRVKLASFLSKDNAEGNMMFIFDEPTTGLHFHDIHKLLAAFDALIANGHTIVVVEHNMDVIKCADWVIDLGPEAGDCGGEIVAEGTPDRIMKCEKSHTGKFLRQR